MVFFSNFLLENDDRMCVLWGIIAVRSFYCCFFFDLPIFQLPTSLPNTNKKKTGQNNLSSIKHASGLFLSLFHLFEKRHPRSSLRILVVVFMYFLDLPTRKTPVGSADDEMTWGPPSPWGPSWVRTEVTDLLGSQGGE